MNMSRPAELTGNDFVSLTDIASDASIDRVTALHAGLAGLVEWAGAGDGTPLFRLRVGVGDQEAELGEASWRRLDRWIPTFTTALPDGLSLTGTICAPAGYPSARWFIIRVEFENGGRVPQDVDVMLDVRWAWSRLWIETGRPLAGPNRLSAVGDCLVLESAGGRGPAMALMADAGEVRSGSRLPAADGGAGEVADNGVPLAAQLGQRVRVLPNQRVSACFYAGVGRERDGARAAAAALRRSGPDVLVRQARLELSHTLRAAQDHRWADVLNRNLLFNRFFSVGRAIDTDQLVMVRSRSTHCPAPALFNEREAMLWTVPALVLADPNIAREALFRALDLFSERSGEFRRYLDGGSFDGAFSLEQCLLYSWAIDYYATTAQDPTALEEPLAIQVVAETDAGLFGRLHPEHMLCGGDVLPSGEALDHPYPTLGNVLLRSLAEAVPRLLPNGERGDPAPRFLGAGAEIGAAIWQHCVTHIDGEQVFASSVDLLGNATVYDDPEFSLALLPFLGFCDPEDPVWTATMEFLHSPRYPLWREGQVPGLAGRAPGSSPRLAALIADMHGADPDAPHRLLRIDLPAGVAAGAYDAATGEADEPHHAALAGFLAWSLVRVAEPRTERRAKRGKA
jgi:uncharacterized protein